ncbi:MAG: helix-turn-helix transcriptional regulator [Gemmatimonadaceae bacterium]|nr:helix-turn-helix transcriptional regulator [Gemmatimonadaceae bacterium]
MYHAHYARPTPDPRLEITTLRHEGPLPPGWLAPGFVVNLVVDGEADLFARGAVHRVGPGSVVLADAGEFRRVSKRVTHGADTRSLTCESTLLASAIAERTTRPTVAHFRHSISDDPRLAQAVRALYSTIDSRAPSLVVESAVERFFDAVSRNLQLTPSGYRSDHPAIRRVREMIDDRAIEDLTLVELSKEASLSRAHLIRAFTREVGVTPHQYLLHARITRARALLANGASPARAAVATGFCDQSHLTRYFTRVMGVGPAAYRRAVIQPRATRRG